MVTHILLRFGVGLLCEVQASSRACVAAIISTTHCMAWWNTVTSITGREREGEKEEGKEEGRRGKGGKGGRRGKGGKRERGESKC